MDDEQVPVIGGPLDGQTHRLRNPAVVADQAAAGMGERII
jgi:hypothetical protein